MRINVNRGICLALGIDVQSRKSLISVFLSICIQHPVSCLLLHREPTFFKGACEGTLCLACLFGVWVFFF